VYTISFVYRATLTVYVVGRHCWSVYRRLYDLYGDYGLEIYGGLWRSGGGFVIKVKRRRKQSAVGLN